MINCRMYTYVCGCNEECEEEDIKFKINQCLCIADFDDQDNVSIAR